MYDPPQQDLAGNMYALENGNDLLFKEEYKWTQGKTGDIQNMSQAPSQKFWLTASMIESTLSENTTPCLPKPRIC